MGARAAVAGADCHNGWAILVSVSTHDGVATVVDRRRVELIAAGLPSQPYHHEAAELDAVAAAVLVGRVKASAAREARAAISRLARDLGPEHRLAALAIRESPNPPIPEAVAEVLRSRRASLAADGELYRRALCDAARGLDVGVETHPRGSDPAELAARALRVDAPRAAGLLAALGRDLGAPWRKEHRSAAAAALAVLGRSARLRAVEPGAGR